MQANEYQEFTRTTVRYPSDSAIPYLLHLLTEEVGEVNGVFAKAIRDGWNKTEIHDKIRFELGDVCWALFRLMDELGYTPEQIMEINVEKLQGRVERNTLHGEGDNR